MAINWGLIQQNPNFSDRAKQGLALGQEIKKYNTDKEMTGVYERLMQLMDDPDFNMSANTEIQTLMAERPKLADAAMQRFDMMDKKRKQEYVKDFTAARDSVYAGDIEGGLGVLGKRVARLTKEGKTPDDAIRAFRLFQVDQDKFVDGVNSMILAETGKDYSTDEQKSEKSKKTANIRDYEYYQGLVDLGKTEEAERFANKSNLSRLTPREQAELEIESSRRKAQDTERTTRIAGFAGNAVGAADSMAGIVRSMELLNNVKTGGFQNMQLAAKKFFGIDAADEGELSFRLGKNVLSQLKATFGAAFTAGEVKKLDDLEANFGRSPESNRRILETALTTARRASRRGLRAAKEIGDDFTAGEIQIALDRSEQQIKSLRESKGLVELNGASSIEKTLEQDQINNRGNPDNKNNNVPLNVEEDNEIDFTNWGRN